MDRPDVQRVAVVVFDGVDELDAIGPYEVLSNAAERGCELSVELATVGGAAGDTRDDGDQDDAEGGDEAGGDGESTDDEPATVTGSHGLRFEPDGPLADDVDLVIVPGGGWNDPDDAGAWAEAERGDLPERLRERQEAGVTIASVCTGGMLLAEAGVLEGRPATTHRGAADELAEHGAERVDARVVDDGDVLTAGGVTAGIDLALRIVETVCGHAVAAAVAEEMEHRRSADVLVTE